ncbi:MAG TPA: hypothetical protein VMG10_08040 [Gemmataceae bacterium]|nr:hypothetical protein [Gemmataceae bacterium]
MQSIRIARCLMLCILASLTTLSVQAEDKGKKDAVPAGWQLVKPKIGGVTFLLPKDGVTKIGNEYVESYTALNDGEVFIVTIAEEDGLKKPGNTKKVLEEHVEKAVKNLKGKLTSKKEVSLGDHPGLEYKVTFDDGEVAGYRVYAIKNHLIELHSGPANKEKSTTTYYKSLKLVKK